jgi:hypothetical protein
MLLLTLILLKLNADGLNFSDRSCIRTMVKAAEILDLLPLPLSPEHHQYSITHASTTIQSYYW